MKNHTNMSPAAVYKFCPKCAGVLKKRTDNLLICQKCGFKFYQNAVPCNAVVIENDKGEILLVKRKFDPQKNKWDWPGGFLNGGENFEHSVIREIKEELGVEIMINRLVGVYTDSYEYQHIDFPILCVAVFAKITRGEIKVSDDVSEYQYFPPTEILNMDLAFKTIKVGISDYLQLK